MNKIAFLFAILSIFFIGNLAAQDQVDTYKHLTVKVVGKGEPLLFIPGYSCSMDVWKEVIPIYQDRYECHVVTLPGFAENKQMLASDFLSTVRDELISYIQDKKLQKPVIIGHSMGGFMGLYISASAPDLLKGVVVVDGLPYFSAMMNPTITKEMALANAKMMQTSIEQASDANFKLQQKGNANFLMRNKTRMEETISWSMESDRKTLGLAIFELITTDIREDLAKTTVPVKHLGAFSTSYTTEATVREMITAQYQHLKTKEIVLTDQANHFIMYDDQAFLIREIDSFLEAGVE